MRNLAAVLIAIAVFTGTVVVVNAQGASVDAPFSYDIRFAAERMTGLIGPPIAEAVSGSEFALPEIAFQVLAALALALPALFAFALFGRKGG